MLEDLKSLGLGDFTSLITGARVSLWGNEFLLECMYDPIDRLPYRLAFQDCHEIKWYVHSPKDVQDSEADLIDIQLGEDNYRKHAVIYTDIFELLILYGSLRVEKEW